MKYLTIEEVLLIHERILAKFGGAGGLRSERFPMPRAATEGGSRWRSL